MIRQNKIKKIKTPTNPHSSEKDAKLNSVSYAGKNYNRDCVPKPTPFPGS
jgi:hypothetical protein